VEAVQQVVGRTRGRQTDQRVERLYGFWKPDRCAGRVLWVGKTDPAFQRFTEFGIFKSVLLVNATVHRMKESEIFLHNFDYSCNDGRIYHDVGPINFLNWKFDLS
jgi:hypothetical protein